MILILQNIESKRLEKQKLDFLKQIEIVIGNIRFVQQQNNSLLIDTQNIEKEMNILKENTHENDFVHQKAIKINYIKKKEKDITHRFIDKLTISRNFRISFVGYIILLHFVIFVMLLLRKMNK